MPDSFRNTITIVTILGQEPSSGLPAAISKLSVTAAAQQKQQEILKQVEQPFVPKDPPIEFEFIADPPSISALDLLVAFPHILKTINIDILGIS